MDEATQIKMLKEVQARLEKVNAKLVGPEEIHAENRDLSFEIKLDLQDGFDPCLAIGPALVWVDDIEIDGIKGETTTAGFVLGYETYDPGVRYHADGSGTPPSTDLAEVKTARTANEAARKAFLLAFSLILDGAIECADEDVMFEDYCDDRR